MALGTSTDAGRHSVSYKYQADGFNRLVSSINWGTYSLQFIYDARPDRLVDGSSDSSSRPTAAAYASSCTSWGRRPPSIAPGTSVTCKPQGSGISLLSSITMRGHDADGSTLDASTVTLTYTQSATPVLQPVAGPFPGATPAPFSGGAVELVDWNEDGLPDVFELSNGAARVWPNLGRNSFGIR